MEYRLTRVENNDPLNGITLVWEDYYAQHMIENHGITIEVANSVLLDINAVVLRPDPSAKSGETTRIIGFSSIINKHITVIVFEAEKLSSSEIVYGVNAWQSDKRDINRYEKGENNDTNS